MPALGDGISGVWAWPSEGAQPAAPRYGLADACAYLLFGFDAARAGRRDLVHARLIGPRMKPFLIDDRPRLCVGVRFAPGFVQAAFDCPRQSSWTSASSTISSIRMPPPTSRASGPR